MVKFGLVLFVRFIVAVPLVLVMTAALFFKTSVPLAAEDYPTSLRVALVQFAVEEEIYDSHDDFFREVRSIVNEARNDYGADFIVFPEYINAFALLDNYDALIDEADGALDFLEAATEAEPLPSLLLEEVKSDTPVLRRMWSDIAREYRVWILAGTAFVPHADGGVRNRAWLFNPAGELIYHQDKIFLTPVERNILHLSPGRMERVTPFTVEDVTFGLTICRDGFFDQWEVPFEEVEAWLEIRANGEVWTSEVRRRFDTAMPERVRETDAETGLSTSLTGTFLDQIWEGPTHVVDGAGLPLYQSSLVDGTTITVISLE